MSFKLLILSGIFLISLNSISSKLNYVVCDDGVSACSDGMQCCQKGTGYRCCPSSLCCCQDGNYCCSCSNLRIEINLLQSSSPNNLNTNNNSTEPNAFYGAYLVLDSFLNITGYYKYSRNAAACRDELKILVDDGMKLMAIFNNQSLIQDKADYYSRLTAAMSEVLFHARELIRDCEHVPEELQEIIQQITSYVLNWDNQYLFKIIDQIEKNIGEISQLVYDINNQCSSNFYLDCGRSLGTLFKLVFEV
jgi:hypothetical protein